MLELGRKGKFVLELKIVILTGVGTVADSRDSGDSLVVGEEVEKQVW